MKDDFDFDPDFDLDELDGGEFESFHVTGEQDDELVDFDELLADDEDEPAHMRTAVLKKNNLFALLCIKSATQGAAICRVDPREDRPAVQIYDDPQKAFEWFTKSLRTSKKNGWQVIYDGLPLRG
jgi:hypothetical protein